MHRMKKKGWIFMLIILVNLLPSESTNEKQKRQIFREQVLPALGGKIPEEAFRADRLALNRLNKEGITVPDGIVLDARRVVKHSDSVVSKPDVVKVLLTPDGRYVPPEGRYHYNSPKTVDTTYVIRMPIDHQKKHHYKPASVAFKPHLGFSKPQGYANYHQYHPTDSQYYKPILPPLILPTRDDLLGENYYPEVWHFGPEWDVIYSPYSSYFIDKLNLFNSNPVITEYQGTISDFHDRSLRHINADKVANQEVQKSKSQNDRKDAKNSKRFGYTSLLEIPQNLLFSCNGRTGTFADTETKCQVFHECTPWSKTSSLCPEGTAYSELKKRCDWWHKITCH